ncbi:hypothetical protein WDU94_000602 [Cyamophila willieti]
MEALVQAFSTITINSVPPKTPRHQPSQSHNNNNQYNSSAQSKTKTWTSLHHNTPTQHHNTPVRTTTHRPSTTTHRPSTTTTHRPSTTTTHQPITKNQPPTKNLNQTAASGDIAIYQSPPRRQHTDRTPTPIQTSTPYSDSTSRETTNKPHVLRTRAIVHRERSPVRFTMQATVSIDNSVIRESNEKIVLQYFIEQNNIVDLKRVWENSEFKTWPEDSTSRAAFNGSIEILRFLREEGCPWGKETTAWAAERGHLKCLQYLIEEKCPWDPKTTERAALRGQLEILKFLKTTDCPWSKWTKSQAITTNQLECLRYLHEVVGLPWHCGDLDTSAYRGHLECMKYAHENGAP